jgi:L-ascorbate metabolism protein UlaG (beta-lactamase superfamily)
VIDDTMAELGQKPVAKQGDVLLFTSSRQEPIPNDFRLFVDQPGEYEASDLSITGIAVRGYMDEPGPRNATMYKLTIDDANYLFTGHATPDLTDDELEAIGMVDVLFVPVGGNGYTLDATDVLKLVKKIEPKVVVPTHYADSALRYPVEQQSLEQALKNLGMEPKETTSKLRFKQNDPVVSSATQLIILTRV